MATISELRKLQLVNFNLQWEVQKLQNAKRSLTDKLHDAQEREKLQNEENEKKYSNLITQQREEIQRVRAFSVDACKRHDSVQDKLNKCTSRLEEANRMNLQLQLDLESEREKCAMQNEEIDKLQKDLEVVSGELKKAVDGISEKNRELEECRNIITVKNEGESETEKKSECLENQVKEFESVIKEQDNYISELEFQVKNLAAALLKHDSFRNKSALKLGEWAKTTLNDIEMREKMEEAHENDKRKLEAIVTEKQQKIGELEIVVIEKQQKIGELGTQIKTLEDKHANQQTIVDKHIECISELENQVKILGTTLEENKILRERCEDSSVSQQLKAIINEKAEKIRELQAQIRALEEKHASQQIFIDKQSEFIKDLESQVEILGPALEENRILQGKCEDATKLVAMKDGELRELKQIVKDDQIGRKSLEEMCNNEKLELKGRIEKLTGEHDQIIKFVEGVKVYSEFKENDSRPLTKQLDDLGTHVQNRFLSLKRFCDMMERTLKGQLSPVVTPIVTPLQPSSQNIMETSQSSAQQRRHSKGLQNVSKSITKKKPVTRNISISGYTSDEINSSSESCLSVSAKFTQLHSTPASKETDEFIDDADNVEFIDLT